MSIGRAGLSVTHYKYDNDRRKQNVSAHLELKKKVQLKRELLYYSDTCAAINTGTCRLIYHV